MKRVAKLNLLFPVVLFVAFPFSPLCAELSSKERAGDESLLVGRISHLEGRVLRYVSEEDNWVVAVEDAPFGMDDALRSAEQGKGEFIMPNNTWLRINGDTHIRIISLKEDITGIEVASGIARFYNKGSNAIIKVTTPFGYVAGPAGTSFDLYVGEDSVEVISLEGAVEFVHMPDQRKFEVIAGSSSIVADNRQTSAGQGHGSTNWEDWNDLRDNTWKRRAERQRISTKYLPPALKHEAWVLDEYGTWANVYYEGAYRHFWRPVHVSVNWAPFTVGRWTLWCGDHCWIPAERFGYVTHHYGNWVLVKGIWYWAPPVVRKRIRVRSPSFHIGFAWYPGRVAWIHSGVHLGWVPLAPFEPYYTQRRWGPRSIVVKNVNRTNIYVGINKRRYAKRAVIIHRDNLHRVKNYQRVRIRNRGNTPLITKYRTAPFVDNRVIRNYRKAKTRYDYRNINPVRKPHRIVNRRIRHNKFKAKMSARVRAKTIREATRKIRRGNLVKGGSIVRLRLKNRLVSPDQVGRPLSDIKLKERKKRTVENSRDLRKGRAGGRRP